MCVCMYVYVCKYGYTVSFLARLVRDPRAGYRQSLNVLEHAKLVKPNLVTKSSIMLGCGEADHQVLQTLKGEDVQQSMIPSGCSMSHNG